MKIDGKLLLFCYGVISSWSYKMLRLSLLGLKGRACHFLLMPLSLTLFGLLTKNLLVALLQRYWRSYSVQRGQACWFPQTSGLIRRINIMFVWENRCIFHLYWCTCLEEVSLWIKPVGTNAHSPQLQLLQTRY